MSKAYPDKVADTEEHDENLYMIYIYNISIQYFIHIYIYRFYSLCSASSMLPSQSVGLDFPILQLALKGNNTKQVQKTDSKHENGQLNLKLRFMAQPQR